ncbi:hypothetical protein EDB87DRAFT_1585417 [Lactarius vividus]|nr:hypothetical protein EDB87DRAFT_1585417 [Lactarius vividus]
MYRLTRPRHVRWWQVCFPATWASCQVYYRMGTRTCHNSDSENIVGIHLCNSLKVSVDSKKGAFAHSVENKDLLSANSHSTINTDRIGNHTEQTNDNWNRRSNAKQKPKHNA